MVEASRVAEIIAEFPNGTDRGSGYRTSGATVLTAAHVVANATRVRVRFDADTDDEWETVATAVWSDPASDLAVLSIGSRGEDLPPARFGRIGDRDAVLPATAVGFPLWKLKNYDGTVPADDGRPRYRDTHHATGMVAVLSNRREGTLEFTVAPPDRDADPEPWQGMSGAALWLDDRIVGVLARHHRTDGPGRLTAVRLDRALTPGLRERLEITEPLPDVVRPQKSELVRTDYRKQVEAIAPETLLDRADELAELTRFVAGDAPYTWWRAGPWAGKSALMSWFVLHPPEGVDVVSFFVTRSLGGQEDGDAFVTALALQLAARTGDVPAPDPRHQLWRLLAEAGARSRRLLVVVDGLDEDTGPAHGKPSIASLLPLRPPPNVRVLIASRPDPPVPDDVVDEDHPLLTCPRRELATSPHARSIGRRAIHELNQQLRGDELDRDVLGLVTASGGGLTRADLAELTGRPPYEIDRLLDGPLGRTIGSRPAPLRPEEKVHLFAHETLAQAARDKFGAAVRAYRTRLHAWADDYRERGWPAETPQYLLIGYPRMLVDAGDHDRLVAVATDRARHDRMLQASGGDGLAASEIRQAQDLLSRGPDLSGLLLLAAHNDELARRNSAIPVRLPLVWMMLGDTARADALARGIIDRESQARSLIALAEFAASTGDHERFHTLVAEARTLARGHHGSVTGAGVLAELASAVAEDPDLAISIVHDIPDRDTRDVALTKLAESAAANGEYERARPFAAGIARTTSQAYTLTELARSAAAAGQHEQAGALLSSVTESRDRIRTVKDLVRDAVAANGHERAHRLLRAVTDPDARAEGMAAAAEALTAKAEYEQALAFTQRITKPVVRTATLVRLARAVRDAGDHDRATSLLAAAWTHADGIADHHERAGAKVAVVAHSPSTTPGMLADAEDAVRAVPDVGNRAGVLSWLAEVTASAGDQDRARALLVEAAELVGQVTDREDRDQARAWVLRDAAAAGEHEWASAWLGGITDPGERVMAMVTLAEADHERASSLLDDAATLARTLDDQEAAAVLGRAAGAAAGKGDHERALAMANGIADTELRDEVLSSLVHAAKENGDLDRASSFAQHITDGDHRDWTFGVLATAADDDDEALLLAHRAHGADPRNDTLTRLAEEAARAGEYDRAREFTSHLPTARRRVTRTKLAGIAAADGAWEQVVTYLHDVDEEPVIPVDLVVTVAKAGNPDLASALAREGEGSYRLLEMLPRLAEVALAAGDRDRARALLTEVAAVVSGLPKPENRSHRLGNEIELAVATGDQELALAFAQDTVNRHERAVAITRIAEGAAAAGDLRGARELAVEAESCARTDYGVLPGVFMGLPVAAVLAGEPDRARRIVHALRRGYWRTYGLADLALAAAEEPAVAGALLTDAVAAAEDMSGYGRARALTDFARVAGRIGRPDLVDVLVADAQDAIAAVTEVEYRAALLADLAQIVAGTGHRDTPRSLLAEAMSLTSTMPGSDRRAHALATLARSAVAVGDLRQALAIAGSLTRPERRTTLTELALAASDTGDHELARSAVGDLEDPYDQREALKALMVRATAAGEHERARSLALIAPDEYRAGLLTWLAQVATATGAHERALSLVRTISRRQDQAEGLLWLVRAALAAGDRERARMLAGEITGDRRGIARRYLSGGPPAASELYTGTEAEFLVDLLIATGDREKALAVARDIDATFSRGPALAKVVDAEIAAGNRERALAVVREITDPMDRNPALVRVVEAFAAAGETARARALLAEVLVRGPWHEAVQLAAKVAPEALRAVLDELEAWVLGQ